MLLTSHTIQRKHQGEPRVGVRTTGSPSLIHHATPTPSPPLSVQGGKPTLGLYPFLLQVDRSYCELREAWVSSTNHPSNRLDERRGGPPVRVATSLPRRSAKRRVVQQFPYCYSHTFPYIPIVYCDMCDARSCNPTCSMSQTKLPFHGKHPFMMEWTDARVDYRLW